MKRGMQWLALGGAAMLPLGGLLVPPATAAAAGLPVFDPANYAQNVLQAARALEQVNHQVEALQNQAMMLQNMARNLERIDFPELRQMQSALERIDALMQEAQGIGFEAAKLDQRFRAMFPDAFDAALKSDERAAGAKARLEGAMDAFRRSMSVQAGVVANVRADALLLDQLVARSQGAVGALQAQQATNQLLALGTKQQLQLQELMAADYRSQAIESARRAQAQAEARAATRRFLGTGKAYPRPGD